MATIPVTVVRNKFFVFAATRKHGNEARNALLQEMTESLLSDISIAGARRADSIATGIYCNHLRNKGGNSILDSSTRGSIRGR
jgi:hypothetical protein